MKQANREISDEKILLSDSYRAYLQRLIQTVSGRYDLTVRFSTEVQTDGTIIEVNPVSPLLAPLPSLEQKTLAILGQLAHEYFHIAYTDFHAYRLLLAKYRDCSAFRQRMIYRLFNIIEDAAIERGGSDHYVGLFRRAVYFSNHVAFSQMPAIDDMERRGSPGLQVLSQGALMYAILGRLKGEWLNENLEGAFTAGKALIDQGKNGKDSFARLHAAEALFKLWQPWVDEMERNDLEHDQSFRYVKTERLPLPKNFRVNVDISQWEKRLLELHGVKGGAEGFKGEDNSEQLQNQSSETENFHEERNQAEAHNDSVRFASGLRRKWNKVMKRLRWDEEAGHASLTHEQHDRREQKELSDSKVVPDTRLKAFNSGEEQKGLSGESRNMGDLSKGVLAETDNTQPMGTDEQAGMITVSANEPEVENELAQLTKALSTLREQMRQRERVMAIARRLEESIAQHAQELTVGLHNGIFLSMKHLFQISEEERRCYLEIREEMRYLRQSVIRQWQVLAQHEQGLRESGLASGRLDERRLWRADSRLFYRRTQKAVDSFSLAILILVDESGSMKEHWRWLHALRACILLEEVCRACNIPLAVMGHLAVYGQPRIVHHHYLDFGEQGLEKRMQMALMGPKQNTREGLSLRYAGLYIKQALESGLLGNGEMIKPLIFSLSDGEPEHEADRKTLKGMAAQEDARAAVRDLERNGVRVIGVAIGEHPSAIRRLYDRCVEVENFEALPQRLLSQVMSAAGWM